MYAGASFPQPPEWTFPLLPRASTSVKLGCGRASLGWGCRVWLCVPYALDRVLDRDPPPEGPDEFWPGLMLADCASAGADNDCMLEMPQAMPPDHGAEGPAGCGMDWSWTSEAETNGRREAMLRFPPRCRHMRRAPGCRGVPLGECAFLGKRSTRGGGFLDAESLRRARISVHKRCTVMLRCRPDQLSHSGAPTSLAASLRFTGPADCTCFAPRGHSPAL